MVLCNDNLQICWAASYSHSIYINYGFHFIFNVFIILNETHFLFVVDKRVFEVQSGTLKVGETLLPPNSWVTGQK